MTTVKPRVQSRALLNPADLAIPYALRGIVSNTRAFRAYI